MIARWMPLTVALFALAATGCELTERGGGAPDPLDPAVDAAPLLPDAGPADAGTPLAAVTWHRDIRPLFAARCDRCHGPESPSGLDLTRAEDWFDGPAWWAAAAADSIDAGRMPPHPTDADCHPVIGDPPLDGGARALIRRWAAQGFPVGDPRDAPRDEPTPTDTPVAPDLELTPAEGYVPDFTAGDDHRCLLVGEPSPDRRYVRALTVRPEHPAVTRRARVWVVPAAHAAELEALDAAHPGPGYPCFGGPGLDAELLLAWQPAQPPLELPAGAAMIVQPGDRLVTHVQYTPAGLAPDAAVDADRPAVALWLDPVAPADRVRVLSHGAGAVAIPAHSSRSTLAALALGGPYTIIGVVPHMLAHGQRIESTLDRLDGDQICLLQIDDYAFEQQATWLYAPRHWVAVAPGDIHRLRCEHDNDSDRPVGPGDGPGDDTCVTHLVTTAPYAESGP